MLYKRKGFGKEVGEVHVYAVTGRRMMGKKGHKDNGSSQN